MLSLKLYSLIFEHIVYTLIILGFCHSSKPDASIKNESDFNLSFVLKNSLWNLSWETIGALIFFTLFLGMLESTLCYWLFSLWISFTLFSGRVAKHHRWKSELRIFLSHTLLLTPSLMASHIIDLRELLQCDLSIAQSLY